MKELGILINRIIIFIMGCIKCSHHSVSFTQMPLAYVYWSANHVVMFKCIIIFQVEL